MSQTHPLDRVIKRIETPKPDLDDSRGEKLVLIDARRGRERVLQRRPFWGLGVDLRTFVVSSLGTAECQGPDCRFRDLATGRSIDFRILYEARCATDGAESLVLELGAHDNPQLHLDNLLEAWTQELLRERKRKGEDVIGGFYSVKPLLEKHLVARSRGIGLEIEAVVELKGESELRPFLLNTSPFSVKLKDYDQEVSIRLKAEFVVDPDRKLQAVLRREHLSELEARVKDRTRTFMLESVSLHDLTFGLKDGVRADLRATLEKLLVDEGRSVAHLVIDTVSFPSMERSCTVEYPVRCKIKEPSTEVVLDNTLLLALEDLGRWRMSGFSTLEEWCETAIAPVAREQLFDRSYLDLLLEFTTTEERIKELVKESAARVGYSVHHHIVLPALPPLELPKGFSVEFDGEFATLDSRIEVGLEGVFHGRIPNLRKIERLLSPRIDVEEEMKRSVLEVTKRVMHGIHPERFYMRFQQSDVAGESPVEEEIRGAIRAELESCFAVVEPTIVLKVKETPLTKRVTDLCKGHHSVELICTPLLSAGADEEVPFVVYFEVLGVRDWFTFYSKGYESATEEIKAIKEILVAELKSMLETVPQKQLQYREFQDKVVISQHVFTRAVEKIDQVFGLMVRIITMRRLPTIKERTLLSVHASYAEQYGLAEKKGLQRKLDFRLGEYDRLVKRLAKLQESDMDPDDPEILRLREQIAEFESEITQKSPDFGPKLITEGGAESSERVSWDAYGDHPSLITSGQSSEPADD